MKIHVFYTKRFTKDVNALLREGKLLLEDYQSFQRELLQNPKAGDVIVGSGGVRKIRLKSSSRGKSGGFRVCYFYFEVGSGLYFIKIFPKNVQENLSYEQIKFLKELTDEIKKK